MGVAMIAKSRSILTASLLLTLGIVSFGADTTTAPSNSSASQQAAQALNKSLPTVFLAGDSTAQNGNPNAVGWGKPFAKYIDPAKANFVNAARGGRSSRTFVNEGLWDKLAASIKPGDFVFIQFGHNDGGVINEKPARGSLPGTGEEIQQITSVLTNQPETVHTFGWYMRKMVRDTKAKGGMPILISCTVRDEWTDGKDGAAPTVERGPGKYQQWTKQIAAEEKVAFVDLTDLVAKRYEQMGEPAVKALFPKDSTHTGENGAAINAEFVLAGLKAIHRQMLIGLFSPAARAVDPAPPEDVTLASFSRAGPNSSLAEAANFLNLVYPADPALPSVVLIGDSTVRNGRGDGGNGQWGWGDPLSAYFDANKANVVNRALGGTGARTFMNGEWADVLALLKPGDIVLIQFGTNDNGPTGPLKGTGEETQEQTSRGGAKETVHTYGWYLRKYIADIKSKARNPGHLHPRPSQQLGRR